MSDTNPSKQIPVVNDPATLRRLIRTGVFSSQTSGQTPGYAQGNVAILPRDYADEFLRFCQANPKPCPILAMSEPGDPRLPRLGADLDIRTDVSRYCVFRDGVETAEADDLMDLWRDDFVTFVLGCSFSFEQALIEAGLKVRHIEQGRNVPMYRTNIPTVPSGRFGGPMVVSMRPFAPADAIRAIQTTTRFPNVHGAPVHFGDPAAIGIADISRPTYGDSVDIQPGEVPVFWACGVTPQSAIRTAKPPISITHKPGCMLVTDLRNAELAIL